MSVHEPASSVGQFLNTVRSVRRQWKILEHKELWFRAEDKKYTATQLRPKLYRSPNGKALRPIKDILEMDEEFYAEFMRCGPPLGDLVPDGNWDFEWYFLMQHHGVPTRLLDWTDGALIALHFAVRAFAPGDQPLIFVLDPYWLIDLIDDTKDRTETIKRWEKYCKKHPWEDDTNWDRDYLPGDEDDLREAPIPKVPLLWDPPHVSGRVAAQRSRFMIFGTDASFMSDLAARRDSHVDVIPIDPRSIKGIKDELREAGVTESVIFPDLDGLGRELHHKWEDRE